MKFLVAAISLVSEVKLVTGLNILEFTAKFSDFFILFCGHRTHLFSGISLSSGEISLLDSFMVVEDTLHALDFILQFADLAIFF